jgi:2-amino-4-hydroxy-6-hydroxymethyldihydropteridine diphosphokinase
VNRTRAYLGIGANLGDREAAIHRALADLESSGGARVTRVSSLYETEPLVAPGDAADAAPWFLNCVAEVATALDPIALLDATQAIERRAGRVPRGRWAPREIDVDILLYGDVQFSEARLTIPHPALTSRRFVLVPLAEIAPELLVPGAAPLTIAAHLSAVSDPLRVLLYSRTSAGAARGA